MDSVEAFMSQRQANQHHPCNSSLHALQRAPDNSLDARSNDLLTSLWSAVKAMKETDWASSSIPTPHAYFADRWIDATPQQLSISAIPSQAGKPSHRIRPDLRLYNSSMGFDNEITEIDRVLASEYIKDILITFERLPKECIKQLLALPVPFDYHHILVETILACLFTPTSPRHIAPYYGSIFVHLFKALPKHIPPLFGRGVNALFLALPSLDVEVRDVFAKWFSFHLSNFGYKWPWANWKAVRTLSMHTICFCVS